jgi:membrane protein
MRKAWNGNIFSEAAEAAFWQALSLPPLLLGLLGSLGYVAEWFGDGVISSVQTKIVEWSRTAFSESVVNGIIEPTVNDILSHGRGEILTVGFLISLWAGSSAMSSFVDAITVAHDQYGVRHDAWQRIFALLLYLVSLVLLVVGLPVLALGPDLLPNVFPVAWRPEIRLWVAVLYYPTIGVLSVLALATLYKLALPRKLPWHRGLPGAILAMALFLLSSIGLRLYIGWITTTGYTYGALATPIAFLLFAFFIGLAVVFGAYFNAAIQEMYPARMTRRQRRRWRRLEMEHAAEQIRAAERAAHPPGQSPATPPSQSGQPAELGGDTGRAPSTPESTASKP